MNTNFKTLAVAVLATITLVSCEKENIKPENNDDQAAQAIASQFVDHTVAPTYSALAANAEQLASQLADLKANPTDAGLQQACTTFLAAREQWEKSEAFLFGAAGDYGVDPHIDSWPLDVDAFNNLMNSPNMLAALAGEDGDVVAGEQLGNALLGFHGIEYILFNNGQARDASEVTETQMVYAVAVAGDLRNRCFQLEVSWIGDAAAKTHRDKVEELELNSTVNGGSYSYGAPTTSNPPTARSPSTTSTTTSSASRTPTTAASKGSATTSSPCTPTSRRWTASSTTRSRRPSTPHWTRSAPCRARS